MGVITSWLKSLFEPTKRKYTSLDRFSVERCEEMLKSYDKQIVMKYFSISASTLNKIKQGKHRYSTNKEIK